MPRIHEIIMELEKLAPLNYQEHYDNCGLLVGDKTSDCSGVLLSLDCTEEVIQEAIRKKCNLIVSHHPIIFSGLKALNGSNYVQRTVIMAIQNNIALYACHTNIDNVIGGVNSKIAALLNLQKVKILSAKSQQLKKLVTYVPVSHHQMVLNALFDAGAGHIGNYSHCSFNTEGKGTFKGYEQSQPFIGKANELSTESELKIETVYFSHQEKQVVMALLKNHPYEEVAYDLYQLDNSNDKIGSGVIGELENELTENEFLSLLKSKFKLRYLKHSPLLNKKVKKISICGGSGHFLIKQAMQAGSDVFVTADLKYHDYFEADNKLVLVDIGHYESEQFTPEIFYDVITNKFSTFAVHLSKVNTNPVNYF